MAAQGKALVHLDGPEANEAKLKELFSWKGEHNAYSNFEQMLDQEPPPGMMAGKSYTQKEWENFTGEKDGLFKRVSFPSRPSASASALPSHFKVKAEADVPGYGVPDLDALPRPAKEK